MDTATSEIAACAARLIVEEGLEYGPAKHRAAKQLGMQRRVSLPGNDEIEAEVRDYIALFCADSQPVELRALRELARRWMLRLAVFRPHLGGAVWRGTATRRNDVFLQLFCDDSKSAEIALIDQRINFSAQAMTGFTGYPVDALSIQDFCKTLQEHVGVHLLIYDYDDLRGALKPDKSGFSRRGNLASLDIMLQPEAVNY